MAVCKAERPGVAGGRFHIYLAGTDIKDNDFLEGTVGCIVADAAGVAQFHRRSSHSQGDAGHHQTFFVHAFGNTTQGEHRRM